MKNRKLRVILAVSGTILCSGCTSALWEHDRFAHFRYPAVPNHVRLYYSEGRKDVLVQYDESREENRDVRTRAYWVEPNAVKVNAGRKPRFVSVHQAATLAPIPITNEACTASSLSGLHAMVSEDSFTLYSEQEQLNAYRLPVYPGASQRVKQVLLTPFAILIDATIVGAIIAAHFRP
ncbi:MAG TPA: hypothetical protein VJA21_07005 [Verrucomicrobiae bacterium]